MKMKAQKVLGLLAILVTVGCSSTPQPPAVIHCNVPQRPSLPQVDAGALWDKVGAGTYDQLQEREKKIVDWALQLEAIARGVCNG